MFKNVCVYIYICVYLACFHTYVYNIHIYIYIYMACLEMYICLEICYMLEMFF